MPYSSSGGPPIEHRSFDMKIGIVLETQLTIPGGVQEHARGLYDFLDKNGHTVEIIGCGDPSTEDSKRNVLMLGKTTEIPLPKTSASIPYVRIGKKEIENLLEDRDFDILHFHGPGGPLSWKILSRSRSVNIVTFHIHHTGLFPLTSLLFRPWGRRLSRKISKKIAVSKAAASFARRFYPGPYTLIPNAVDHTRFQPEGEKIEKYLDGRVNILFVGRLDRRKGVHHLLKAYLLLQDIPNLRLLIVGEGPERKKGERFSQNFKLKNIHFLGRVSKDVLPRIYRTADIFCAPATHGESFGIVLLEALASSLPIVAYANDGYKEVLGHEPFDDFLVRPGDINGLAEKIRILLTQDNLRSQLKKAGLEESREYSWDKVGKRLLSVYTGILNKK